ncbi:MAG: hypothetical protein ACM3ZA_04445 [Bacillota bacterium]
MDFRSLALNLKRELEREFGENPAVSHPRGRTSQALQLLDQQLDDIVAGRRRFQWVHAARLFGLVPRQGPALLQEPPDLLALLQEGLRAGRSFLVVGPSRPEMDRMLARSPVKPMGTAGQWAEALLPLVEAWDAARARRQEAYARQERLARGLARLKEMHELRQWQVRVADKAASLVPEVERLRASTRDLQTRLTELDRQLERARKAGALGRWALGLRDAEAAAERDQVSLELRMGLGALHIRETELQKWQEEALSRQQTLRQLESGFEEEFGCAPDPSALTRLFKETREQARQLDAAVREAAVSMEQAQETLLQGARLVTLAFDEWPASPVLLDLEYDTVVLLRPEALHPGFLFLAAGLARARVAVYGSPPEPPTEPQKQRRRLAAARRPLTARGALPKTRGDGRRRLKERPDEVE